MPAPDEGAPHSRSTRRQFLLGGTAAAGAGAAAALGYAVGARNGASDTGSEPSDPPQNGGRVLPDV